MVPVCAESCYALLSVQGTAVFCGRLSTAIDPNADTRMKRSGFCGMSSKVQTTTQQM